MTKSVRENFVHDEGDLGIGMFITGANAGGDSALVHQVHKFTHL